MATDDAARATTTDRWGRPVVDGGSCDGPLGGDASCWPAGPMLVLDDEDVVTCATEFCRAFSSEYFFSIWLIAVDENGWTTRGAAELLDLPQRPPPAWARHIVRRAAEGLAPASPGSSVVVAIADPDGGDHGPREVAWTRAVLDAAGECGLAVRGVVAVGAHRARLLHSPGQAGDRGDDACGEEDDGHLEELGVGTRMVIRDDADLAAYAALLWETSLDEGFLLRLVPLGAGGVVLPGAVVVHDLPDEPEPVDRPGVASLLGVVGACPGEDVTAVSVVVRRPSGGVDGAPARAWARLVQGAAADEAVPLRGIVSIGDGGVHVLAPTSRR